MPKIRSLFEDRKIGLGQRVSNSTGQSHVKLTTTTTTNHKRAFPSNPRPLETTGPKPPMLAKPVSAMRLGCPHDVCCAFRDKDLKHIASPQAKVWSEGLRPPAQQASSTRGQSDRLQQYPGGDSVSGKVAHFGALQSCCREPTSLASGPSTKPQKSEGGDPVKCCPAARGTSASEGAFLACFLVMARAGIQAHNLRYRNRVQEVPPEDQDPPKRAHAEPPMTFSSSTTHANPKAF